MKGKTPLKVKTLPQQSDILKNLIAKALEEVKIPQTPFMHTRAKGHASPRASTSKEKGKPDPPKTDSQNGDESEANAEGTPPNKVKLFPIFTKMPEDLGQKTDSHDEESEDEGESEDEAESEDEVVEEERPYKRARARSRSRSRRRSRTRSNSHRRRSRSRRRSHSRGRSHSRRRSHRSRSRSRSVRRRSRSRSARRRSRSRSARRRSRSRSRSRSVRRHRSKSRSREKSRARTKTPEKERAKAKPKGPPKLVKEKPRNPVISESEDGYGHEADEEAEGSQAESEDSEVERAKKVKEKLKGVKDGAFADKAAGILTYKDGPPSSKKAHKTLAAIVERFTQTALPDKENESMKKRKLIPPPKNVSAMRIPPIDAGPLTELNNKGNKNALALDGHMVNAQEAIMDGIEMLVLANNCSQEKKGNAQTLLNPRLHQGYNGEPHGRCNALCRG